MTAMYTLRRGGAYDRFILMVEAFLERECEVHCVSLTPIQIEHSLFRNHVAFFPFKKTDSAVARLLVFTLFPFWCIWIAWRNKIDLVIAFGSLYAFLQGFSKWFLERPMTTLIRGNSTFCVGMRNFPKYAALLNRIIEKIGLHFSDRIITNNTALREEILKGLSKGNIEVQVLFNDIRPMTVPGPEVLSQTRGKYGIPRDAKVLVTSGILNPGKNVEFIIKCLPKIEAKNVFLLIVGDGSTASDFRYQESLKKLAEELSVSSRVVFTGWVEKEELRNILRAADLFVFASKSEGMPNAMLEAMGADLACFGSEIPGIKDILFYQDLLFDPTDGKALVQKVRRFFLDHKYSQLIKDLCRDREKIFEFDWQEKVFQIITERIASSAVN